MDDTAFWTALGLHELDAQVYRQLLLAPLAAPSERADELGTTVARVRRSLDRLVELRLARPTHTGVTAIEPGVGLAGLVRRHQAVLDTHPLIADELASSYAAGRLHASPQQLFEVVRGRTEIVNALVDLFGRARTSVAWTDTPPYLAGFDPDLERVETQAIERGLSVRCLYDSTVLDDPAHVASARTMTEAGEQSHLAVDVHTKLVLIDDSTAFLPLARTADYGESHAVVVHHSAITGALVALFELLWQRSTPAPWARSSSPHAVEDVSHEERQILQLMGAGVPDAAIARHLRTTERTLRRRIEGLRERTSTANRFQLGVHAARHGWL